MSWTRNQVLELLKEYKSFPYLYQVNHKQHKNKNARRVAMVKIVEKLCHVRPGTTIPEVKLKLNSLRSTYMIEAKKMRTSNATGGATDDIYIPQLYYFQEMDSMVNYAAVNTNSSLNSCSMMTAQNQSTLKIEISRERSVPAASSSDDLASLASENSYRIVSPQPNEENDMKLNNFLCEASSASQEFVEQHTSQAENVGDNYIHTFVTYMEAKLNRIVNADILDEVIRNIEIELHKGLEMAKQQRKSSL